MPNLILFGPLHRWYGEGGLEHTDLFASWSMANIKMYHPWLYHIHAIAVIWAVLAVRKLVFQAHSRFVTKRMSWMKGLQYPRANTVLVEEIPKDCRSKEQLQKFFCDNLGPDSVACVEKTLLAWDWVVSWHWVLTTLALLGCWSYCVLGCHTWPCRAPSLHVVTSCTIPGHARLGLPDLGYHTWPYMSII